MLNTVVCDDEIPALDLMSTLLQDTGRVRIAAATRSIHEALDVVNRGGVDLVVLDIEMPALSGVRAYQTIAVEPKPLLVFATAHPEYALDAFDVDAIDFLLKPFDAARVGKAVEKAARLHEAIRISGQAEAVEAVENDAVRSDVLSVRDSGKTYFIPYDEVIWIEAAGDYSLLHTTDREYAVRVTLRALADELPPARFARVHRSAIIGVSHVREIRRLAKGEAMIALASGAEVKASRSYRDRIDGLSRAAGR